MLSSIQKILLSKWEFKEPARSDVLIYDADPPFAKNLQKILKKNTYQFFYIRGEVLNLPILIKTLTTTGINKLRFNYKKNIAKSISPKFVITNNHQDVGIYNFKKYGNNVKIIIIQSSVYFMKFFKKHFLENKKGNSIKEVEKLKSLNIDIKKLAKDIIQHFLRHAIRDGFFHADMHQGNLFVTKNSDIVPVDFGIMGRIDKNNRKYLAEILYGFIKRDYKKVAEVHFLAGLVSKNVSKDEFAQALRSIGEPIFGQSVKNISGGKLLSQLFEITEKFNMQTQIQLLLLQKTMVVVEGVARKLDPDTNIWNISRPILENWLKEVKDPINKANEFVNEASEVLKRLPDLPIIMDKANDVMTLIAEGKFNPNTLAYKSLREEKLKLELMRNKILGGVLVLVIFVLIVFK